MSTTYVANIVLGFEDPNYEYECDDIKYKDKVIECSHYDTIYGTVIKRTEDSTEFNMEMYDDYINICRDMFFEHFGVIAKIYLIKSWY